MKLRRSLSLIASLSLAACGGSAPPAGSPSGTADTAQAQPAADQSEAVGLNTDDSTADLAEHHRHHHHGGFAMFIAMSLDSLGTTPDQEAAISKIQADMHATMQPAHDAEKQLLLVLADGVAAGQVDEAKADAAVQQLATASAGVHDAVADSLNALHDTLTPPQRQALVDKVESHLEVWHQANMPADQEAQAKHAGHVSELANQLSLTPDQVEKIRTAYTGAVGTLPKFDKAEADAHLKAFAEAFTADKFDAHAMHTGGALSAHMATWGASRMVKLYSAAAPVLTPEQRTKAADELRSHANYKRSDKET
ncbi:MAG TPA: Spy/CpxP family protein refolding chaperone [Kofleriaceae bacterium]|jgi:Spy/CpxP family protein refolding chaperone